MNNTHHLWTPIIPEEKSNDLERRQYLVNDMGIGDVWRVFRIMAEFAESFETLGKLPDAVTVFGSARTPEDHIHYQKARKLGKRAAQEGFSIFTGEARGSWKPPTGARMNPTAYPWD